MYTMNFSHQVKVIFIFLSAACLLALPFDHEYPGKHDSVVDSNDLGDLIGNELQDLPRGCGGKPADVYFAFDTSSDVTSSVIHEQKNYAKALLQMLHQKEDTVRIGTIIYGDSSKTNLNFNKTVTANHVKASINNISDVIGGRRNVGKLFRYIREEGFSDRRSRSSVGQVAIVFIAGGTTNFEMAVRESQLAKDKGIYIYIIALNGWSLKFRKRLGRLSSQPASEFVFSVNNYHIANSLIRLLHIHLCDIQIQPSASPATSDCAINRPVDLIFSVDEVSIGARNSEKIFHLIEAVTSEFDSETVKIALVNSRNINFRSIGKRFENVDEFISKLGHIKIPDHSDIFRRIRRVLKKGRTGVQKTVIHFVDANVGITKRTLVEAKENKKLKMETYVIAVGTSLDTESVNTIASYPAVEHVIRVPNYQMLVVRWKNILNTVCKGW